MVWVQSFSLQQENYLLIQGKSIYTPAMQEGFGLWNATAGLNTGCVKYHFPIISSLLPVLSLFGNRYYSALNETWRCVFAEYIYPFITTPVFVVNSKNDKYVITNY